MQQQPLLLAPIFTPAAPSTTAVLVPRLPSRTILTQANSYSTHSNSTALQSMQQADVKYTKPLYPTLAPSMPHLGMETSWLSQPFFYRTQPDHQRFITMQKTLTRGTILRIRIPSSTGTPRHLDWLCYSRRFFRLIQALGATTVSGANEPKITLIA